MQRDSIELQPCPSPSPQEITLQLLKVRTTDDSPMSGELLPMMPLSRSKPGFARIVTNCWRVAPTEIVLNEREWYRRRLAESLSDLIQ
jgi:hypothetical protein